MARKFASTDFYGIDDTSFFGVAQELVSMGYDIVGSYSEFHLERDGKVVGRDTAYGIVDRAIRTYNMRRSELSLVVDVDAQRRDSLHGFGRDNKSVLAMAI